MESKETFNMETNYNNSTRPQHSPWNSPIPYLFGGLAAMLGLIALALLMLACSYWRLSGYLENNNETEDRDLETGEEEMNHHKILIKPVVLEDKFLVIMAGEVKPTFLATPVCCNCCYNKSSSFDESNKSGCSVNLKIEEEEKKMNTIDEQLQSENRGGSVESLDQTH